MLNGLFGVIGERGMYCLVVGVFCKACVVFKFLCGLLWIFKCASSSCMIFSMSVFNVLHSVVCLSVSFSVLKWVKKLSQICVASVFIAILMLLYFVCWL